LPIHQTAFSNMVKRIVIHAGFHKTGTTTIQNTLRQNKPLLRPDISVVLRDGMLGLCEAARAYSVSKSALDLGMVQFETAETLQEFTEFSGTLLLSSEDLSGHMPGRRGLKSYAAAPKILNAIYNAAAGVFSGVDVSFFFGTRAAKPWLNSCYAQHLQATRITQSAQDYSMSYKGSAQLNTVVDATRNAVPHAFVLSSELGDCSSLRLGLLDPLLDHLEVPQSTKDQFEILPPANTAPPQAKMDKLLALNRSDLSDTDLKLAKRALNQQVF
jgi:hypothetical protein